jgi:heme oxygenase
VDALFSDFDLSRSDDYRRFLTAQAAAFLPVEQALDAAGAAALFPDGPARRRATLLHDDLDELGLPLPAPVAAPSFATSGSIAGGAYVLEGSRLGGAMLARGVAADLPRRFLSAPQPPGHWRSFLARLEQVLATHVERERAVTGAEQVFELFARAARVPVEPR